MKLNRYDHMNISDALAALKIKNAAFDIMTL
jgi:hypothetical protein